MTHNPPIRIYINKTENGITFKIKIRRLSPVFNTWNDETLWKCYLEISEVILVHYNLVRIVKNLFEVEHLGNYQKFHQRILYF